MKLSHKGKLFILHHEAVVLDPYQDSVGVWTIGAGVTAASGHNPLAGSITLEEAIELFDLVVARYDAEVQAELPGLNEHQHDAAVSFHYNTGAIGRASWTKHLDEPQELAARWMQWNKPPEVIKRRRDELRLFLHGDYGPLTVPIYHAKNGHVQWHSGKVVSYA